MGYPKEIIAESRAILAGRRKDAVAARDQRRAQIAQRAPEALEQEREIRTTCARLARAVLSGGAVAQKVESIRTFNLDAQAKLTRLLTDAGFSADALDVQPFCPRCRDTGIVDGSVCGCLKQIQKRLMYDRLGCAAPIEVCGFDRFDLHYYSDRPDESGVSPARVMTKALEICRTYAKDFTRSSPSLLLRGAPGLGKTHLSLSIGYSVVELGFDVLYVPFHTLLGKLEAARFGKGSEEYLSYLAAPLACELLILDDLGSEFATSFGSSVLYDLVNTRQLKGIPSIINTNLGETELRSRYGDRLHSRIYGCYKVIPFAGSDIRQQKKYAKGKERST